MNWLRVILVPICVTFILLGNMSQAQEVLEEIVVTAQKREQILQNVPISVFVVSGAKLVLPRFKGL